MVDICFIAAGVTCNVATVKRLGRRLSADFTFISFGIIEPILVILKTEYRLSRC